MREFVRYSCWWRKEDRDCLFIGVRVFCLIMLLFAFGAAANNSTFEIEESFVADEIQVHVRIDKKSVSISDTVMMEIEAAGLAKYTFDLPEVPKEFGDFEVIDVKRSDDRLGDDDRIIKSAVYRLEPMVSGKVQVPSLDFEYIPEGREDAKSLRTSPIEIEVASMLGREAETAAIADIENVIEVKDYLPLIIGGGLGLLFCMLMVLVFIKRSRRKERAAERVYKAAHEIALQRLRELEDQGLVSAGRLKLFYESVSNVLRYYIEDRFSMKAPERTTEEFLAEIKYDYVFSAGDKDSLEQFLRHCDLVKFAKHQPDNEQVRQTVELVRDFIDRTKSDECLIEIEN